MIANMRAAASTLSVKRGVSARTLLIHLVLVLLAAISWGGFFVNVFWPAAKHDSWRRPGYWVAARLAYEGRGDLIYGRPQEFAQASYRLGTDPDVFDANMPTTLIPFMPLAGMAIEHARSRWALFTLLCFLAAWVMLLWAVRLPIWMALAASALVPFYQPWVSNIYTLQIYAYLLLASVAGAILAARGYSDTRRSALLSVLSGVAYGLGAVAKLIYGAVEILVPLARRQWKVVAGFGVMYGAAGLLTLLWVKPEAWSLAIQEALSWRGRPETAVTAYQTANGLLMHLFNYDAALNPGPLANLPWLAGALWWGLAAVMLAVSGWAIAGTRRDRQDVAGRLLPYALAVPVALILAPIAEDYHYTLALLPLCVTFAMLWRQAPVRSQARWNWSGGPAAEWVVLLAATVLLGWNWRFANVPGTEGWNAFAYYPRVYGILLLWGLMIFMLRQSTSRRVSELMRANSSRDLLQ